MVFTLTALPQLPGAGVALPCAVIEHVKPEKSNPATDKFGLGVIGVAWLTSAVRQAAAVTRRDLKTFTDKNLRLFIDPTVSPPDMTAVSIGNAGACKAQWA